MITMLTMNMAASEFICRGGAHAGHCAGELDRTAGQRMVGIHRPLSSALSLMLNIQTEAFPRHRKLDSPIMR